MDNLIFGHHMTLIVSVKHKPRQCRKLTPRSHDLRCGMGPAGASEPGVRAAQPGTDQTRTIYVPSEPTDPVSLYLIPCKPKNMALLL